LLKKLPILLHYCTIHETADKGTFAFIGSLLSQLLIEKTLGFASNNEVHH